MSNPIYICAWCERPFSQRKSGGKPQKFHRESCRRKFDAAIRDLGRRLLDEGGVALEILRRDDAKRRSEKKAQKEKEVHARTCVQKGTASRANKQDFLEKREVNDVE